MTTSECEQSGQQAEQFLTFFIAGEIYAVEILNVQEIRRWEQVRELPNTPDFIKGALNLRGSVVPIVDLRQRFNLGKTDYSPLTVVIVLRMQMQRRATLIGIVADAVAEVLEVNRANIKEAPNLGTQTDTRYMRGLYVANEKMVLLLDVDKLLDPESFTLPENIG